MTYRKYRVGAVCVRRASTSQNPGTRWSIYIVYLQSCNVFIRSPLTFLRPLQDSPSVSIPAFVWSLVRNSRQRYVSGSSFLRSIPVRLPKKNMVAQRENVGKAKSAIGHGWGNDTKNTCHCIRDTALSCPAYIFSNIYVSVMTRRSRWSNL